MDFTRHRVQFDVPEDLFDDLNALIPRGVKRFVMEVMCRGLVDKLKKGNRAEILSAVMTRKFEFDDTLTVEMLDGLERTQGKHK